MEAQFQIKIKDILRTKKHAEEDVKASGKPLSVCDYRGMNCVGLWWLLHSSHVVS